VPKNTQTKKAKKMNNWKRVASNLEMEKNSRIS